MQCNGTSFHKFSKSSDWKKTLILEKSAESDFPFLRSIYWGLVNLLTLKKIRFASFTNFWKIVCFVSLLSGLSLVKILLPKYIPI